MNFQALKLARIAALAACALGVTATHAQEELNVVSIQASTGALAYGGIFFQNAIRLAVDETNAKGGIHGARIRLIERDNGSDKGQAIHLANQAADRDRALLVLGPTSTADALAVAPVFAEKQVPDLHFGTSDATLKASSWSMKFQQSPAVVSALVARYTLEKTPIRKVAFVYDRTNEAWIDSKNNFRDPFKAGGGAVVAEEAVVTTDANFQPLATKLKTLDVDAVYLATYPEQSANIILQLRQAGIPEKVRFIGAVAMVSPKFLAVAGKAAEGAIAVSDHVIGLDRPLNKAFEAAYRARYGAEPDSWAAVGYSLALVGMATLKEAGPRPTREKVRDAFMRLRDVPILGGSGLWNQTDRKPDFGAVVLLVKDGRFVVAP
ncbi:ABC transporter substrate-binding protein [Xylophilus sp. ASV27]|uniref:ABC transporter substrate-binding protein n=1 Tax=Xylophilus sp. ASV27 TaxID=2795129 RepID=UPI0018EAE7EF|nr:ABC transporter substrate-binding protein [Xylophilus sp. ASV27]